METAVYIGNETMQMVYGEWRNERLYIDTYAERMMPEGTVLNGVITGEEQFIDTFRNLMTEHPDLMNQKIKVIIGGDQIQTQAVEAPELSEKNMLKWIQGEFSEEDTQEEVLYDYRIIRQDTEHHTALICAVRKKLIGTYVEKFEEMGTEIKSISAGLDCQIRLLGFLPDTREESFLILTLDGNSLFACVYVDGVFRVSSRARLFSDRGTLELSSEVERVVSNLLQFAHTDGYAQKLQKVYLCGCHNEEIFLFKNISQRFSVKTDILRNQEEYIATAADTLFRLDKYVFAAGALI